MARRMSFDPETPGGGAVAARTDDVVVRAEIRVHHLIAVALEAVDDYLLDVHGHPWGNALCAVGAVPLWSSREK